jgi:hypothetical protein
VQLIPQISALNPVTTAFPLVVVLSITAIKDAVDDYVCSPFQPTCMCFFASRLLHKKRGRGFAPPPQKKKRNNRRLGEQKCLWSAYRVLLVCGCSGKRATSSSITAVITFCLLFSFVAHAGMCGAEHSKLAHASRVEVLVTQAMSFPPLHPTLSTDTSAHAETAPERQDGQHAGNRSAARRGVCVDLAPPPILLVSSTKSSIWWFVCSLSYSSCGTAIQR